MKIVNLEKEEAVSKIWRQPFMLALFAKVYSIDMKFRELSVQTQVH